MSGFEQGLNTEGELIRDFFVKHDPVDLVCPDDGMTRQEFAAECDINVLLAQYEKTGVLTHYSARSPQYLDVSEVPDLLTAMQVLDQAQAAFMTLPAVVRKEFDNDPVRFMEYAAKPENLDQMRKWGLAPPAPEEPAGAISSSAATPPAGSSGESTSKAG